MSDSHNDVSKLHRRYSLTLFSPSSYIQSLILSLAISGLIVTISVFVYLDAADFVLRLLSVIAVLLVTQLIDSWFIKNREYSKAIHMSLFGNSLWLITLLAGILSTVILSRENQQLLFLTEGMFLFASFRIGILTTVLGASLKKAWLVCMIQPLAMFLALVPMGLWQQTLFDFTALAIGSVFIAIASLWSYLTDRAGRPGVRSTHKLVQAYLSSLSQTIPTELESLIVERSKPSKVATTQICLKTRNNNTDFRIVLPEIHPGPFHPVGGSNIPYLIYKNMNSSAMVMHSVSNHSFNLPSKAEVDKYLASLSENSVLTKGLTCTEPVTVQVNKARVVGMRFDKIALLFLSLSPHGMEDIPLQIKNEIEQFSKNRNFERVLIVDCHNAMGEEISSEDSLDLLSAAKSNLDTIITKKEYPIEFGYANSKDLNITAPDLAQGGIGVLCLQLNNKKYFLGWADANNMENGVREEVIQDLSTKGYNLLEICTSDSHFNSSHVRNKNGYYQFGIITKPKQMTEWFFQILQNSEKNINEASFEIVENKTNVKVMGPTIFRDYSKAVDNSLKLTKGFLFGCLGFFLFTMFL